MKNNFLEFLVFSLNIFAVTLAGEKPVKSTDGYSYYKKDSKDWVIVAEIGMNTDITSIKNSKEVNFVSVVTCQLTPEYTIENNSAFRGVRMKSARCRFNNNYFNLWTFCTGKGKDGKGVNFYKEKYDNKDEHIYIKCR